MVANKVITENGVIALGPNGVGLLMPDNNAPNGVSFNAVVTVRTRGNGRRYATIDFPVADYSAVPGINLIWHGIDGSAVRRIIPVSGKLTIDGIEEVVFGRCANLSVTHYELCAVDVDGLVGSSDGIHLCMSANDDIDPPDELPTITTPPAFNSVLVAGEVFTFSEGVMANAPPDAEVVYTFDQADDAVGTNLDDNVTVTALTAPAGAAEEYLRITMTVTIPSLDNLILVSHGGWTFVATAVGDIALTTPPAFTSSPTEGYVPVYSVGEIANGPPDTGPTFTFWEVETATGGTPTQVTLVGGKFPLANMKDYVEIRREIDDASLTNPLVDFSERVAVVHLPKFTGVPILSALEESVAYTRTPAPTQYATLDVNVTVSWQQANDGVGTSPTELLVPTNTMPSTVNAFAQTTDTMTGDLLTGAGIASLTANSGWVAVANAPAGVPATPVPTFGNTVLVYDGADKYFRPTITSFSGHTAGDQYEITTSLLSPLPDDHIETMVAVAGGYQPQMDDPAKRVDPNTQTAQTRTDYSVFRFIGGDPYVLDETKGDRLRFRRRNLLSPGVYGPWSEFSAQFTCPPPEDESTDSWQKIWIPMVMRSPQEKSAKLIAGPGLQFLRSFAVSAAAPGVIFASMDQNFPWESRDGGETFITPSWTGMFSGRQGLSTWIDPTDANRRLCCNCLPLAYSGVYLSTDGGETCSKVLALPNQRGTNSMRHNFQLLAHKPGGTPTTRTVFMMSCISSGGSPTITSVQLYRSTNAGATWSPRGSALNLATFSGADTGPYEIIYRPSGDLMLMCTPKGLWWSADDGLNWTKATGLPGGAIHHIQIASTGTVLVGTNEGIYKATNGKAYSIVPNFGTGVCKYFGMSPEDDNYVVAAKVGQVNPFYTINAMAATPTWTQGANAPRPGQAYNNAHSLGPSDHGGIVGLYGSRERFFFHRDQQYGVSTDHGQNVRYAGFFFDGHHIRGGMGFDLTDWKTMAGGLQDICSLTTIDGGVSWLQDTIGNNDSGPGLQIANATGWTQYLSGAGPMIHSSGRTWYSVGNATGTRAVVGQTLSGSTVGAAYVYTTKVSGLSDFARIDPNSANRGYIGSFRSTNLNAAALADVTFTKMTYHFATLTGFGGNTVLYGTLASGNAIYRSTDFGVTWTLWRTTSRSFRPVDIRPGLCACPHHASRVYAVSGAGYLVKIEGNPTPTETTIFDARDYISGAPDYQVNSVVVDPFNANLGYLSLYMWGCANVFQTTNLLNANPTWVSMADGSAQGLPHVDMELSIHPLTSDVIACGSHGEYVLAPPAGHRTTYSITNSIWDEIEAYLKTIQ